MNIKTLSAFLLLSANLSFAGNEGGGGGGICLGEGDKQVCRTLAETGFRLSPEMDRGLEIDEETLSALKDIYDQLPSWFGGIAKQSTVVGNKADVVSLEVEDTSKVKIFIDEYKNIILKKDPTFNFANFELLGFTLDRRTYLIAGKFKQMKDPTSRAILLMHESYIRNWSTSVPNAIRMDGMVLDYLKAKRDHALDNFNFWDLYKVLADANIQSQKLSRSMMVAHLVKHGMPMADFVAALDAEHSQIPYNLALGFRKYHPEFAKVLGDVEILIDTAYRKDMLKDAFEDWYLKHENEKRSFYVTAEDLNSSLASALANDLSVMSGYNYRKFSLTAVCGNFEDKSSKYVLRDYDQYTSIVLRVDCDFESFSISSRYDYLKIEDVFPQIRDMYVGTKFNFEGSLKCTNKSQKIVCK